MQRLTVKPDMVIKRRGKLGLVKMDADMAAVREWLSDRMGQELEIGAAKGRLSNFIVEPFVPHKPSEELYIRCVQPAVQSCLIYSVTGIHVHILI